MYEIRALEFDDIESLSKEIDFEGVLRGFEIKNFEAAIKNPNIVIFHIDRKAFIYFQFTQFEAELIEIWTSPTKRNKGMADALLHFGIEFLKSKRIADCFLEVATDNMAAKNLYKKVGFQQIGLRKAYYRRENGDFTDAITMKLAIDKI